MNKCDQHVHTRNSHDGKLPIAKIVDLARAQGLCYIATTDHLDYDFDYGKNKRPISWPALNLEEYYKEWQIAKQTLDDDKTNTLTLCFGIEASFDPTDYVKGKYIETIAKYPFDVVINSVHCVDGYDVYFKTAFLFKSKKKMYSRYLDTILDSLDAPYHYDVVAHIGYIAHGAPYRHKTLHYEEFADKIDNILLGIIARDKSLEINFHHDMAPERRIIERYYELGGRKISYSSDSHKGDICRNYEIVIEMLKEIGFKYLTVYKNRKPIAIFI